MSETNNAAGRMPRRRPLAWLLLCTIATALAMVVNVSTSAAGTRPADTSDSLPPAVLTPVDVPGTTAMIASGVDLARYGYTEREFYAEGQAHRYRGAVTGVLNTAQVIDGGWNYKTRVLVRYPDRRAFNGTLVVEWANVTTGQDVDFAWAESYDYLLREGYAVAVVSAQHVGVDRLNTWSPARYGTLTIAADNTDPQTGVTLDPTHDPLSWDIYTEVSEALKQDAGPVQPLPGLWVKRVIAMGESQSAGRLTVYYNTIQPMHGFFDGFVFLDRAGQLRADLPTPAVSVGSEAFSNLVTQEPASSQYFRFWDVAGASHASYYAAQYVDSVVVRDKSFVKNGQIVSFTQLIEPCTLEPLFSTVETGLVLNKAIDSVNRWIISGQPAPASVYFARGPQGQLLRDANGQVTGGIRLPQYTVPTDIIDASNSGSLFCALSGHHQPYTAAQLKQMYGTHGHYVALVAASALGLVRDGYILPYDAAAVIRTAAESDVAR